MMFSRINYYISVIACAVMGVMNVGGWTVLTESLPAHYFSPIGTFGWGGAIAFLILFIVNIPTSQSAIQMIFSAKDDKVARNGYIVGAVLLIVPVICSAIIGMVAAVMFPDLKETATALPKVATTFPGIVTGLVLSGMWGAILTTACAMLVANATLILNDIMRPMQKTKMSPEKEVFASQVMIVLCALVVCYFAMYQRAILTVVTVGLALSVGYFYVLVISWYFPHLARASTGVLLIGSSCITSAAWFMFPWFATLVPHVLYLQLIVCTIVFPLTLLDRRPPFFLTPEYEKKFGKKFAVPD